MSCRSEHRPIGFAAIVAAVLVLALVDNSMAGSFSHLSLPVERADEQIGWFDVDGDGRKDFVRQFDRRLEVYLLDSRRRIGPRPDWQVEITPPWDLWDFADVRTDLPGQELLALSPEGVGWTSYHERTTSTSSMEFLVKAPLPVRPDARRARRGRFAVKLARDGPADLLLPSRRGLQIFRRKAGGKRWEKVDELTAPLGPSASFRAESSRSFLCGVPFYTIGRQGIRRVETTLPTNFASRRFNLFSFWSAPGYDLTDWNLDGRLDWIVWASDPRKPPAIYLQTLDGRFDRSRPIALPRLLWPGATGEYGGAGSDRTDQLTLRLAKWRRGDFFGRRFLADVDGDRRLDLTCLSVSSNLATPKTRVTVYLQRATGDFADEPDERLRLRAIVPTDRLPLVDLDGDGDLDLMLLRLDLELASVNSQLKAFMREGVDGYLGAYVWSKGGFSKPPAWEKHILITYDMFDVAHEIHPLMRFERDLTGDGPPDLVVLLARDTVGVFPLIDMREGFAREALASLRVPFAVARIECEDCDGDGRTDILLSGWKAGQPERAAYAVFFNQSAGKRRNAP